ncbi:MAG: hypothetical protein KGH85_09090 [Thaumarchaeota archaeon]|nr:hypothetical protein [Nitrososphaerota archaeon]
MRSVRSWVRVPPGPLIFSIWLACDPVDIHALQATGKKPFKGITMISIVS